MGAAGTVRYASIMTHPDGRSKGCAIVEYSNPGEAAAAAETLNNSEIEGRKILIREVRARRRARAWLVWGATLGHLRSCSSTPSHLLLRRTASRLARQLGLGVAVPRAVVGAEVAAALVAVTALWRRRALAGRAASAADVAAAAARAAASAAGAGAARTRARGVAAISLRRARARRHSAARVRRRLCRALRPRPARACTSATSPGTCPGRTSRTRSGRTVPRTRTSSTTLTGGPRAGASCASTRSRRRLPQLQVRS